MIRDGGIQTSVNYPRQLAVALLIGALAGLGAKLADEWTVSWLGNLGSNRPLWIVITVIIGWKAARPALAAAWSACFFMAMVAAYYSLTVFVLGYPVNASSALWLIEAITIVPALSAITAAVRGRTVAEPVWIGLCAALILVEGGPRRAWFSLTGQMPYDVDWIVVGAIETAFAIGLLLLVARSQRRLAAAAIICVVSVWPLSVLIDRIFSVIRFSY